ncbi:pentapeptide repeat-containing protein, partial [Vibrio parahaemolyticus]|uniref:pentapeptide repeat-containing protein n=1 Tax=Vibrio parahaemolyticus TaxID=670 RepID=UPI00358EE6AE
MEKSKQLYNQVNFSHQNLQEHIFSNCTFIEQGALEGCDFSYADLRDASFKDCQLSMSHFKGANCFGIELRDCDLKGANFSQVSFVNQVSNKMYFCPAYITGCYPMPILS